MGPRKTRANEADQQKQKDSKPTGADGTNIRPSDDQLVFELLQYPNKQLRQRSFEVKQTEIDDEFRGYVAVLKNTLFAEGGVGIAAPQIGWRKRIIIVLDREFLEDDSKEPTVILNPSLHDLSGEQDSTEACLSVPMPPAVVKRAADCVVRGYTLAWEPMEFYVEGLESAIFQHEVDHLDGKLYIDRLSRLKRDILIRKYKKRKRQLRYGSNFTGLPARQR